MAFVVCMGIEHGCRWLFPVPLHPIVVARESLVRADAAVTPPVRKMTTSPTPAWEAAVSSRRR